MLPRRSFLQSLCSLFALPLFGGVKPVLPAAASPWTLTPSGPITITAPLGPNQIYVAGELIKAGQTVSIDATCRVVTFVADFGGVAAEHAGTGQSISVFSEGVIDLPEASVDCGDYWA